MPIVVWRPALWNYAYAVWLLYANCKWQYISAMNFIVHEPSNRVTLVTSSGRRRDEHAKRQQFGTPKVDARCLAELYAAGAQILSLDSEYNLSAIFLNDLRTMVVEQVDLSVTFQI